MADRVSAARRRGFVGRHAELELLTSLLLAPELPVAVVFVHGPAGIGKSTLLRRYAEIAREVELSCVAVDARDLPPDKEALVARLASLLGDGHPGTRTLLLLDTYELIASLDGWVRDDLLPRLPADTLVVVAGQQPPAPAWRADPGWSALVRSIQLGNLTAAESGDFLARRGVDPAVHAAVTQFTHGHPLALALVGEVVRNHGSFSPRESPDVIRVLVDNLLQVVPSAAHRRALEACAQVRVTTEPLLAAMLDQPAASELFSWLRGLACVDAGAGGLFPHDLAREVLASDLQWRDPDLFVELHSRARGHYLARLDGADPASQGALLLDLMYLHADLRPFLRPPDPVAGSGGLRMETAGPADVPAVLAMVEAHEGAESAGCAAAWLGRQQTAWQVARDAGGDVAGAVCLLDLDVATLADPAADPAVVAAGRQLARMAPLRPGERATLIRFWLARDTYQSVSPVQSLIAVQLARHYLLTPALAVSLLPFSRPAEWAEFCTYADQVRMPSADFTVGGRTYAVFGHDWRVVTPAAWVGLLSRRETGAPIVAAAGGPGPAPLLVLSEAEFTAAVRRALRDLTRPDRLRDNPLLRSRVVTAAAGADASAGERVAVLQASVREAVLALRQTPADERLYRVLHRAYLAPAPSLERAAEALALPSSTFRRYLSAGVARVTSTLWTRELDT